MSCRPLKSILTSNESDIHFLGKCLAALWLKRQKYRSVFGFSISRYHDILLEYYVDGVGYVDVYAWDWLENREVAVEVAWTTIHSTALKEKVAKLLSKGFKVILVSDTRPRWLPKDAEWINIKTLFNMLSSSLSKYKCLMVNE